MQFSTFNLLLLQAFNFYRLLSRKGIKWLPMSWGLLWAEKNGWNKEIHVENNGTRFFIKTFNT